MNSNNLKILEERFHAYTAPFVQRAEDPGPYTLKLDHTARVCGNMDLLARSLGLDRPRSCLARAAALVHDLGRFPQFERYGTFSDPLSRNHGALGTWVLVSRSLLAGLTRYDKRMLLRAVALHNHPRLPEKLAPDLALLARLVRDADKMDIYKVMISHYLEKDEDRPSFITHNLEDNGRVSQRLVKMILEDRAIPFGRVACLNDMKLFQLSMVYDLNFPAAVDRVRQMGVVPTILGSMPGFPGDRALEEALDRHMEEMAGTGPPMRTGVN